MWPHSPSTARFVWPVFAALGVSFVIWECRLWADGGFAHAVRMLPGTVLVGLTSFPVGLAVSVWPDARDIGRVHGAVSAAGYLVYFALVTVGALRRSTVLWMVLVLLLAINVVGCQLDGMPHAIQLE